MRVALWQCEQHPGDVAGNLARLHEAARRAAGEQADLLVCPEMIVTGYSIDAAAVQRLAEPAEGPSSHAIAAIARETGIAIVWGFVERGADGRVFNAAQAVDRSGASLGAYRKTHLYGELDRRRFSAGDGTPAVFELLGWRVGFLICYDVEFPEAVRSLALQGVNLVVVPTANMQGFEKVSTLLVPARACENQLFVAYANCCGREADITYGGLSVVAGPDGGLLGVAQASPALLVLELDRSRVQASLASYLADRRPQAYAKVERSAAEAQCLQGEFTPEVKKTSSNASSPPGNPVTDKRHDDHFIETYKSLITLSVEGFKFCALANGGAAVALLAYLGNVVGKGALAPDMRVPMGFFLGGLVCCGLGMLFAYLTQLYLLNDHTLPGKNKVAHPWFLRFGMLCVLASLAAFALGAWQAVVLFR